MIIGIGVDLVRIARIRDACERWGERFLSRIFSEAEREYAMAHHEPYGHLAGRFAVKEALMKALGTGRRGVGWREIEVLNDAQGRPAARTSGRAAALLAARGVRTTHVSLAHDTEYSVGHVVLEGHP